MRDVLVQLLSSDAFNGLAPVCHSAIAKIPKTSISAKLICKTVCLLDDVISRKDVKGTGNGSLLAPDAGDGTLGVACQQWLAGISATNFIFVTLEDPVTTLTSRKRAFQTVR